MRIAIELNNVLRDFNFQVMKYYLRDINPSFDETTVDKNCVNILDYLPFKGLKTTKNEFVYIDYPYELFGCAKTTSKHLHTEMYDWIDGMEDVEVILFSLDEKALTIQSTYFFLSKGNKTREMVFPKKPRDIWNYCDVAITTNKEVIQTKPFDKQTILIRKCDNKEWESWCNFAYDDFLSVMRDKDFLRKIKGETLDKSNTLSKISDFLKTTSLWKKINEILMKIGIKK